MPYAPTALELPAFVALGFVFGVAAVAAFVGWAVERHDAAGARRCAARIAIAVAAATLAVWYAQAIKAAALAAAFITTPN